MIMHVDLARALMCHMTHPRHAHLCATWHTACAPIYTWHTACAPIYTWHTARAPMCHMAHSMSTCLHMAHGTCTNLHMAHPRHTHLSTHGTSTAHAPIYTWHIHGTRTYLHMAHGTSTCLPHQLSHRTVLDPPRPTKGCLSNTHFLLSRGGAKGQAKFMP
jgi:hypothetical protein